MSIEGGSVGPPEGFDPAYDRCPCCDREPITPDDFIMAGGARSDDPETSQWAAQEQLTSAAATTHRVRLLEQLAAAWHARDPDSEDPAAGGLTSEEAAERCGLTEAEYSKRFSELWHDIGAVEPTGVYRKSARTGKDRIVFRIIQPGLWVLRRREEEGRSNGVS